MNFRFARDQVHDTIVLNGISTISLERIQENEVTVSFDIESLFLRRCLQQQGVRTFFKSDTTFRPHLGRPKDALEPTKQDGVRL